MECAGVPIILAALDVIAGDMEDVDAAEGDLLAPGGNRPHVGLQRGGEPIGNGDAAMEVDNLLLRFPMGVGKPAEKPAEPFGYGARATLRPALGNVFWVPSAA